MTAAGPKMLKLEVPGLAENRPSVLKGDKIYAQVYTGNSSKTEPVEYEGRDSIFSNFLINILSWTAKLYISSTLNIDFILWHTHLIVCAVKY